MEAWYEEFIPVTILKFHTKMVTDMNIIHLVTYHMAGFSQPRHFFAAGCIFVDFAIAVIF